MKREIKFRGLTYKKEWVYGLPTYLIQQNCDENIIDGIRTWWDGSEDVDPKTVGQFTGLKDKNGKEVYEGDVIDYGGGRHYPITYEVNGFGIKFNHGHERNWLDLTKFEIIGNIYENPELLTTP